MRGSLMTNPKVIKMARLLLQDPEFLEWYGNDAVTLDASQAVTRRHVPIVTRVVVGALTPLWAQVNECAGTDFVLPDASLFEVEEMAGVPGFGRAMEAVHWLHVMPASAGIEFPNFTEHNTVGKERSTSAKTGAERSKEYRERKRLEALESVTDGVTEKSDASRDTVTTEKRRVEKRRKKGAKAPTSADDLPTWMGQLVALYHDVLPELPGVRVMDAGREQALRDFRDWVMTSKRPDGRPRATTDEELLAWARDYFERARHNDFIMGRGPRSPEHKNWRCSIEFLLSSKGVKKVVEETTAEGE
ncbi:hypothetical protein WDL1CHR_00703 [Variovorax sp. WDL1]|nr:hypothetical protein [Variovorax sp. WDL1]KWT89327.1 hypothetical protein APY03_3406 [Variovorax sp. WDL1]PNG56504.1 hypothetical protein CHC07_02921 [Variovorax sp. B4]PNG57927.1 hypothetical protein CHC06_02923 [Variovorax sp. B2]VTV09610.1 hypothetical protein WDL1CHR_00703 [Variovorax sp. WDL1]